MIDAQKTERGERPDLEVIEVNPPIGFIGNKIFPTIPIAQKVGDVAYSALIADAAAQTGRTKGAAPTATLIGEQTKAITAAEVIKRYKMGYSSVPLYGGIAGADKVGAMASKRSVLNAQEAAQLAVLIDGAGTDITSAIVDGLIAAADAVSRYAGRLAFVCSVGTYRWMVQQDEIKNLLLRSFNNLSAAQMMSITPEVFRSALQGLFMFDDVLVFDDLYAPAAYTYTGAVCKISDGDEFSYAMQPELGRTAVYMPNDSQYEINTYPDDDIRANVYDAASWYQILQFNSGAKSLVTLSNATTTT